MVNKIIFFALFLLLFAYSSAQETFAGSAYAEEKFALEESYAEDRFAAEASFDEEIFAEKVISSSGLIFLDKHVEKMTAKDLKDRYGGKYDIDWGTIVAKFGAGTAIIVITGTVSVVAGVAGAEPVAAIAFASCKGAAIGAISGAVVGGGLSGLIEALKSGNLSAAQKGAIESAADGFMWGAAIGTITGGWGKFKSLKSEKIDGVNQTKPKANYDENKGCPLTAKGKCRPNSQYAGKRFPLEEKNPQLAQKYPNSVKFDENANPIFDPYAKATVRFEKGVLKGNSNSGSPDFKVANEKMGYPGRYPPEICGPKGSEPCTWHHKDSQTLQLVPRDLHEAVRHEGGASLIRQYGFE